MSDVRDPRRVSRPWTHRSAAALCIALSLPFLGARVEGCSPSAPPESIPAGVSDFVSADDLAALRAAGLPIYDGVFPPGLGRVTALFRADALAITFDEKGQTGAYGPYRLTFSHQNNDGTISARYTSELEDEVADGPVSFISGLADSEGSGYFSVFVPVTGHAEGCSYRAPFVISGHLTNQGIEELQLGFIVNGKEGSGCDSLIPVGARRIIAETDGLAARVCDDAPLPAKGPSPGTCQSYWLPPGWNGSLPGSPHAYTCCNDCDTEPDDAPTCVTYQGGSDAHLCGTCGRNIGYAPVNGSEFTCGGPAREQDCRAHCNALALGVLRWPGLCWAWRRCFTSCCASGAPGDEDGLGPCCTNPNDPSCA